MIFNLASQFCLPQNDEFNQRFISALFHEMIQSYSKNNYRFEFLISSSRGLWQPLTNISADNLEYFQFHEITTNCEEAELVLAAVLRFEIEIATLILE